MRWLAFLGVVASGLLGCGPSRVAEPRELGSTTLVLIHTADLHSHLFPERQLINGADAARGLGRSGELSEVGGFARIAHVVDDIRAGSAHQLFLDSGDLVEGTATFSEFGGEAELRAFSALHLDAAALGNHDFSSGVEAFVRLHRQFAGFPVLASNIADNGSELASALVKSVVLDAQGIRVGVIGVANPSSPSGLARVDNAYGVALVPVDHAVQAEIDRLRSEADVLVALSHLGLDGDQRLISGTTGLDVVLGGHQHLAFDAALDREDCGPARQAERDCQPRKVLLAHSGALGRYVGELDLELAASSTADPSESASARPGTRRVVAGEHSLIPIAADLAEDPRLRGLLEPYRERLAAAGFFAPLAFALGPVARYASDGADSALGNLFTDALRMASGADFALINATGIRADLPPGELTRADFGAAFPFDDALTVLTLSGAQLRALFDQQARVSSQRECQTSIQVSGLRLVFKCSGAASSAVARSSATARELVATNDYTLVTSTYLADGGSGFDLLEKASARRALELDALQVVLDWVSRLPSCPQSRLPCLDASRLRDQRIAFQPP